MLRMREEAGIQSFEGQDVGSPTASGGALAALIGRGASVGLGIGSPTSVVDEKEGGLAGSASPLQSPVSTVPPANPITSTTNPNLAPGTASGVSAGPSAMTDPAAPVDWDLWQSVVYEGPSAVARTSAEELSVAIASGIPSAIRGVVWQVLAQSKNDELEGVYRELVVRGTDKDRDHKGATNGHPPMNGGAKEKQSVASSASSTHSGHSTPTTTATNGLTSPSHSQLGKDAESMKQLQTAMIAERKKKAKEDAAALQKLEKVIRKDLGARTSYSKYAVAAGLQDGLFGVCKAYALFDEGVGYAQGMNFLIMPLLFNVRPSSMKNGAGTNAIEDAGGRGFLPPRSANESIPSSRHVHTGYAWPPPASLSIREITRRHGAGAILSPPSKRRFPAIVCDAMVPHAIRLPLSSSTCAPCIRSYP